MAINHDREPIGHTCPDIDYLQRNILDVIKNLSTFENASEISDLKEVHDGLEKLRKSNESLRVWGIEEAKEVDKLNANLTKTQEDYDIECAYSKELLAKIEVLEVKLKDKA